MVDFHSQLNALSESDIYRVQPNRLSRSHLPMYETFEVREALISIQLSFEHKVIDLWGSCSQTHPKDYKSMNVPHMF